MTNINKFPYGKEFSSNKISLTDIFKLIERSRGNIEDLKSRILSKYWSKHGVTTKNKKTLAMNTYLTLKSYDLIIEDKNRKGFFSTTSLYTEIKKQKNENEKRLKFVSHLLLHKNGFSLLKVIKSIIDQGHEPNLESINNGLTKINLYVASTAGYVSTMKSWLSIVGVISEAGYQINWNLTNELMGLKDNKLVGIISHLDENQIAFLKGVLTLASKDFLSVTKIVDFCSTSLGMKLPAKALTTEIVMPLQIQKIIEVKKTTSGRGAKPHEVKLSKLAPAEIIDALVKEYSGAPLEMKLLDAPPLEEVLKKLKSNNKHTKGYALEHLAIWMIRLLGLKFSAWRDRSHDTGGAEVDVIAESDSLRKSKWNIQCKNQTAPVGSKVIAREVGLSIVSGADTIVIITTSRFSADALSYTKRVMEKYPVAIFLIDGIRLGNILSDKSNIVQIFKSTVIPVTNDLDKEAA